MSCSKSSDSGKDNPTTPEKPTPSENIPSTEYDITLLDYTTLFETQPVVNKIVRQDYNELSGIAASKINKGILYVHDDNKNMPIIITNTKGDDLGLILLDNAPTINPEDISVGPGPDPSKSYIYYADIGDNNTNRSSVNVYRLEEPVLTNPNPQTQIHLTPERIQLKYPTGSFNAETILVDPLTKDIYIATKESNRTTIYIAPYPQSTTSITTLKPIVKANFDLLTSGDVSPDGKEILLRNKGQIFYWQRDPQKTIAATILSKPFRAPYIGNEPQGEGVGFAADGSGYYTDTEIKSHPGRDSNISFYKRK